MNPLPSAVFLDRDGTIIEEAHYISRSDDVLLLDGAAAAIARMNAALVPVILVTNQSGIGRGYFTFEQYESVQQRMVELLEQYGAHLDGVYHCPHSPHDNCECRKPGSLLFERAARDHPAIDLGTSLYVGDRWRDIEPGVSRGAPAVLIPSEDTPPGEIVRATESARIAPSLSVAVDWYFCTN
ncbi:MAG TPA: HAD-IIIA family hydrolase [Gemmatimonadaceae bacterium]|nr:HAD-IIIA family hydrolase [Gemmatimonadaceae bacterium]